MVATRGRSLASRSLSRAAKQVWRKRLRGRLVIQCIDSEAAKYKLIKGTSLTRDSAWLINEFWSKEAEQGSHSWFERVPSASNCADDSSRGRAGDVKVAGRKATLMRLCLAYLILQLPLGSYGISGRAWRIGWCIWSFWYWIQKPACRFRLRKDLTP